MLCRCTYLLTAVLLATTPCLALDRTDIGELTPAQQAALDDVADRSPQISETAFYMLLAKAAEIAGRDDIDATTIDSPAPAQLLANPQRWRGWPVSVELTVYRIEKLQGRQHLGSSAAWPAKQPVWKVSGKAISDPNIAIVVFSITQPALESVGEASSTDKTDLETITFPKGVAASAIGISYKVWSTKDTQGRVRDYPTIVAWQIAPLAAVDEKPVFDFSKFIGTVAMGVILLIGCFILLIGFILLKIHTRRLRKAGAVAKPPATQQPAGETEQIDPLLKEAAQQYAKEKDAPDDQRKES